MENDRIAKRIYLRERASSHSVGRPRKRWIDTVKNCLKKKGSDVREAGTMVYDRSVWRGFVSGNAWDVSQEDEPLTLARCYSCELSQLYKAFEGVEVCLWPNVQLKGHNG